MASQAQPPGGCYRYSTGNVAECKFADWAEARGWIVTKRGWPDFICRRGDDLMCVEVKAGSDTLSAWQRQTALDLAVHGIPVFEWRPPSPYDPLDGQLLQACEIQRVMARDGIAAPQASARILQDAARVAAAADAAIEAAEGGRRHAVAQIERERRAATAMEAKLKTARERLKALQDEHDQLTSDAGYLLRQILSCRSHYASQRVTKLIRRYGESLRTDVRWMPDGPAALVTLCGTGWPS